MKKYLVFSVVLLCISIHFSYSQNTSYYNRINHVFGAIDKSKVSTGLLKEFGIRINEINAYNGTISSLNWVDITQWQSVYRSLYSMRVGTNAVMTDPALVFTAFPTLEGRSATAAPPAIELIQLIALSYNYQQYKTNAYSNGDVTVSNDRIYDVSGRNPYDVRTAFAVTPTVFSIRGNTFGFQFPSGKIYTNVTSSLSAIAVDFGNGQGYQTMSVNAIKNVTYSSGGEKEIKVRFTYGNGTVLYSHSRLYVDYVSSSAHARFSGTGRMDTTITGVPFDGVSGIGNVTIETAGTDGIFNKPFIVVEGFDLSVVLIT